MTGQSRGDTGVLGPGRVSYGFRAFCVLVLLSTLNCTDIGLLADSWSSSAESGRHLALAPPANINTIFLTNRVSSSSGEKLEVELVSFSRFYLTNSVVFLSDFHCKQNQDIT